MPYSSSEEADEERSSQTSRQTSITGQSRLDNMLNYFDEYQYLDRGGFAIVLTARHKTDGRKYAIKEKETALREVKALTRLEHEHVVRYFGCWDGELSTEWQKQFEDLVNDATEEFEEMSLESRASSTSFSSSSKYNLVIQMELCSGTLKNWMNEHKLETDREPSIMRSSLRQLLEALNYIHSQRVIHRDIKPGNIFLKEGSHSEDRENNGLSKFLLKIGDFGWVTLMNEPAMVANAANGVSVHTRSVGTDMCTTPEQKNRKGYNHKVDVYALGLVYLEMAYVFSTDAERVATFNKLQNGDQSTLPDNDGMEIVKWLTKEDPQDRPECTDVLNSKFFTKTQEQEVQANNSASSARPLVAEVTNVLRSDSFGTAYLPAGEWKTPSIIYEDHIFQELDLCDEFNSTTRHFSPNKEPRHLICIFLDHILKKITKPPTAVRKYTVTTTRKPRRSETGQVYSKLPRDVDNSISKFVMGLYGFERNVEEDDRRFKDINKNFRAVFAEEFAKAREWAKIEEERRSKCAVA